MTNGARRTNGSGGLSLQRVSELEMTSYLVLQTTSDHGSSFISILRGYVMTGGEFHLYEVKQTSIDAKHSLKKNHIEINIT